MKANHLAKFVPALLALGLLATNAFAQTAPAPSPTATATPAPTLAPPPGHSAATPASSTVELTARPAAYVEAKASHDEVFAAIQSSFASIRAEMAKANLKPAGRPIAVFLEADDESFRFRAEIPLESAPAGQTQLTANVKIGQTPAAKAMRFEHRGAYDDVDATYEALTAYLDEKGIDAQDVFVEEYLNDVQTTDDPNLQVDIYVLLK